MKHFFLYLLSIFSLTIFSTSILAANTASYYCAKYIYKIRGTYQMAGGLPVNDWHYKDEPRSKRPYPDTTYQFSYTHYNWAETGEAEEVVCAYNTPKLDHEVTATSKLAYQQGFTPAWKDEGQHSCHASNLGQVERCPFTKKA